MHERSRITRHLHHRIAPALAVLIASAALAGCTGSPPAGDAPSPSPSLTQQQQDAAEFEDLYAQLLAMDENAETREQLADILTNPALDDELSGAESLKSAHERVQGHLAYSKFEVTQFGEAFMVAKVCSNTSGTTIVDASGSPLSPSGDDEISLQMKAIRSSADGPWKISEIVKNDEVHACA